MIIELGNYNEGRALHIGDGTTGSQAQVSYRDEVRRTSTTRVAVTWRWRRQGCRQGTGMHTNSFRVGIENGTHAGPAEQSEKH